MNNEDCDADEKCSYGKAMGVQCGHVRYVEIDKKDENKLKVGDTVRQFCQLCSQQRGRRVNVKMQIIEIFD